MNRRTNRTQLDTRLAEGLDRIAASITVRASGTFDPELAPLTPLHDAPPRRGRWAAIAASVTAMGGAVVGGSMLMNGIATTASPPPPPATAAPPPTTLAPELAPGGLMTFDQLPPELATATVELIDAATMYPDGYEPRITRWYTVTMDAPEASPNIRVTAHPGAPNPPYRLDQSDTVPVQGADGYLFDDPSQPGRRVVSVVLDRTTYTVSSTHLTDAELLLAAEHVRPADDGFGGVVDAAGLGDGMVERGAGENGLINAEQPGVPPAHIIWSRLDATFTEDLNLSLVVSTEQQETLALKRLTHPQSDEFSDATVHGQPAIVVRTPEADRDTGFTSGPSPDSTGLPDGAAGDVTTVMWWENGYTYQLAGVGVDSDTVLEWANRLRPATRAEAEAMATATQELYDTYESATVATVIDHPDAPGDEYHVDTTPPSAPAGTVDPATTTTIVLVAP